MTSPSRAFGPAPKPTWWGYSTDYPDTVLLCSSVRGLRPEEQRDCRWARGLFFSGGNPWELERLDCDGTPLSNTRPITPIYRRDGRWSAPPRKAPGRGPLTHRRIVRQQPAPEAAEKEP